MKSKYTNLRYGELSRIEQFRDKERNDEALTVTERREYARLLAKHSYLRKA